jgi:RNA polymerase sigma-70 factor (ECF subfamily)
MTWQGWSPPGREVPTDGGRPAVARGASMGIVTSDPRPSAVAWEGSVPGSVASTGRPETARVADLAAIFADEAAFRAFYERALPRVYGYLLARCGDAALAEELTQLAFTAALRERRSYDGRADPVVWITGIARHKLVDHFRTREREESRFRRLTVRTVTVEATADPWAEADDHERLVAALARIPAAQRAVLVLHYADGLPVRDVAHLLRRSESAVESLMSRGRVALRAAYGEGSDD